MWNVTGYVVHVLPRSVKSNQTIVAAKGDEL